MKYIYVPVCIYKSGDEDANRFESLDVILLSQISVNFPETS